MRALQRPALAEIRISRPLESNRSEEQSRDLREVVHSHHAVQSEEWIVVRADIFHRNTEWC